MNRRNQFDSGGSGLSRIVLLCTKIVTFQAKFFLVKVHYHNS